MSSTTKDSKTETLEEDPGVDKKPTKVKPGMWYGGGCSQGILPMSGSYGVWY